MVYTLILTATHSPRQAFTERLTPVRSVDHRPYIPIVAASNTMKFAVRTICGKPPGSSANPR